MILQVIYMFWKNIQINFMKIRPVRAKLFRADGHDEANRRFSQFGQRTQNLISCAQQILNYWTK